MAKIIKFDGLKRLEGVLLDRCRFTGPVTLSKASLPNLKMISLANNAGLCGALPDLPFATKEQKEAECDKPWEVHSLDLSRCLVRTAQRPTARVAAALARAERRRVASEQAGVIALLNLPLRAEAPALRCGWLAVIARRHALDGGAAA